MSKHPKSQRKIPQQSRSKELVKAIIEATVRILPKVGSRNLTTKQVAEVAGVSIGSLYQYFPNKEALLGLLMDSALNEHLDEFFRKIAETRGRSNKETIDLMVDLALELFLKDREKVREIFLQAPELGKIPAIIKIRQRVIDQLALEMELHHPGKQKDLYQKVSFIAVSSVMGVIHIMLYDESKAYSNEELALELKTLLHAYFDRLN